MGSVATHGAPGDLEDLRRSWGVDAVYNDDDHCSRLRPPFFTTRERPALIAASATVDIEGIDGRRGQLGAGVDDAVAQVVIRVHELTSLAAEGYQAAKKLLSWVTPN